MHRPFIEGQIFHRGGLVERMKSVDTMFTMAVQQSFVCDLILNNKLGWPQFEIARVVSSEFLNRQEIFNNIRNMKDIIKI